MAIPYNVVRVSGLFVGGEVWSVNPKFMADFGSPVTSFAELQEWATAIAALNTNNVVPAQMRTHLSSLGSITSIRCEYYDAAGKLAQVAEQVLLTPVNGTGTASKPMQSAVVFSLRTGRPGRSYRGRLYWPALGASFEAGSTRIPNATVQSLATEAATWLAALANAAPAGSTVAPAVVSQTLGSNQLALTVQVGDILDTQRRRRDALQEAYASAAIPA